MTPQASSQALQHLAALVLEQYGTPLPRRWASTKGPDGKRVTSTYTFRVIPYDDIPCDQRKEITHVKVVCKVRPQKTDPNRTRITIARNCICYTGDVVTPAASLDLVNLMLNSFLSRPGAIFACFDAANFYLQTPEMDWK